MKNVYRKTYPLGRDDKTNADADTPKLIVYAGDAGTLDASVYENNVVTVQLSSTSAMTYAISNPNPGTTYIFEATGTGTNNRVITLTGCTCNVTGNNTLTANAQDESIALLCISADRYIVTANNGDVALSTV